MKTPDKKALIEEIKQLREAGRELSNICFNLSQHPGKTVDEYTADMMKQSVRKYDAIKRTVTTLREEIWQCPHHRDGILRGVV